MRASFPPGFGAASAPADAPARPTRTHGRVVEIDPRADRRWETFLDGRSDALVYHHPAWLDALSREYAEQPMGLAVERADGTLGGVLPLFRARGLPFRVEGQGAGGRLSSLPRTPLAGPVAQDRDAVVALLTAAVERARATNVRLQLKVDGPTLDGVVDGLVGEPWLPSYALDLPDDPDAVRFGNSRNHGRIVWAIGKAAKQGVAVRPAESQEDLRAWYRLHLETMRANAVPARPYRFFVALWQLLRPRGLMELLLAERHGVGSSRLLAGSIFLMFGRTVFYAFTGARTADLSLRPNDVIQWRAIHDAAARGFDRYDLGEVSTDDRGLVEFKKKWGASTRPLYRYYYPPLPASGAGALGAGSRVRSVGTAVWRHLPLGVTAFVADRLYRYS